VPLDDAAGTAAAPMDPLGYGTPLEARGFDATGWHTSREWLAATAQTRFPDLVPQVVEMFDSPRAGDVVVFADEDWAIEDREAGGHGSALDTDMRVPLYFAGPDLPCGVTIPAARSVDILPTVLDFLGERGRLAEVAPIDGVSLYAELKSASDKR
jgi:arylsulfatase A-like enzyme